MARPSLEVPFQPPDAAAELDLIAKYFKVLSDPTRGAPLGECGELSVAPAARPAGPRARLQRAESATDGAPLRDPWPAAAHLDRRAGGRHSSVAGRWSTLVPGPIAHGNRDLARDRLIAFAHDPGGSHMSGFRNNLMLAGAVAAIGAGSLGAASVAQAKHGSDDPAGHNARDDHGGLRASASRHGADDRPGDDRGGRRARVRATRHGRDDAPGDDHGTR
jgi:hypothetical protein